MPENKKTFFQNIWPSLAWATLILILCGLPGDKFPEMSFLEWLRPDKIVHLILFGVQCFLLLRGFSRQNDYRYLSRNRIFLALTISISYGCLVEVLQNYLFIHRSGDVRDAAANAIGALIGLWIYRKKFSVSY